MYQLLLQNGQKIGQYSPKASPAKTAEKIARVIYEEGEMRGRQRLKFQFVKNRVKDEGGDKLYSFEAIVTPLPRSRENLIQIGNSSFFKKYDINTKNLARND